MKLIELNENVVSGTLSTLKNLVSQSNDQAVREFVASMTIYHIIDVFMEVTNGKTWENKKFIYCTVPDDYESHSTIKLPKSEVVFVVHDFKAALEEEIPTSPGFLDYLVDCAGDIITEYAKEMPTLTTKRPR